jgi:hypothetical protein
LQTHGIFRCSRAIHGWLRLEGCQKFASAAAFANRPAQNRCLQIAVYCIAPPVGSGAGYQIGAPGKAGEAHSIPQLSGPRHDDLC